MCGLVVVVDKYQRILDENLIKRMNNISRHRGPDGEGYYFDSYFAMGHRRLAILDLSKHADQPFKYGDHVLVFNGEIYNYKEIKNELIEFGYEFTTTSDTEVILAAYLHWGEACVQRFNGMWAFIIYDTAKCKLFGSRDYYGIKPLYVLNNGRYLAFASEVKQLIPLLNSVKVNESILSEYLVCGLSDHTNNTFFRDVTCFPSGSNFQYDLKANQFYENRYYYPSINRKLSYLSERETVKKFLSEFQNSIRLRLRSDVKVGLCLSGGLDSSAISATASGYCGDSKLTAITAASNDKINDEKVFAGAVASHFGIDWHVVPLNQSPDLAILEKLVEIQEEPFPTASIFMQNQVFKKARELGCKVMLDGQGGDEILLGYERYYPAFIVNQRVQLISRLVRQTVRNSKLDVKQLILFWGYFNFKGVREFVLKNRGAKLVNKDKLDLIDWEHIRRIVQSHSNIESLQLSEIMQYQLPTLLKYEDKNSMAFSVESRLPFLDPRCVENAISINDKLKMKNGWSKYVLRKSMEKKLSEDIVWRRNKVGFEASREVYHSVERFLPIIKGSEILSRYIRQNVPYDYKFFWKCLIIALWEKVYNVGF